MRLIDAEEAIKRLGDAHFKNYGNAIMVIKETPTVDAIPVEWLSKLADECANDEDPYVQINGLLINVVITKWEQRIEDEHEPD